MSNFVVTAILRDFSSSNNNSKWEISCDELLLLEFPSFSFYANGNCKDNEGYVSILFSKSQCSINLLYEFFYFAEIHFNVCLVDVAGSKRFMQSVVIIPKQFENLEQGFPFGLERYLKRETLLNDPAELLPDDCLTICVDVKRYSCVLTSAVSNFKEAICRNETEICILLDTDFGRELCRLSEFFRRASDIPMMESRTRKVLIPEEEYVSFSHIWSIFNESDVPYMSIARICDLYRVADKYDIQSVIKICRQFIKAFLCVKDNPRVLEQAAENVPKILELAEDCMDDDLKETLQTYLESKEYFRTNYDALVEHLKEILHTEWKCEFEESSPYKYTDCFFTMTRRIIEPEFQFYQ